MNHCHHSRYLLVIMLMVSFGTAQSARSDLADYQIANWQNEDGLPENSATAMIQDADGYLWFGTFNGLVRYDGAEFRVFNSVNTPELPGDGIVNLHLDRRGWMWVSTLSGTVI